MDINELESFKLSDAVKFHDNLNPALWTKDAELMPEVRKQLMVIAKDFLSFLGVPSFKVEDITISGSNAAYSYTPHSDIDLHVLVDFSKLPNDEVYKELFTAKKQIYNDDHNITIHNVPVELYVQDSNQKHVTLGEYSLLKNKWIKIPSKRRANFDQTDTRIKYEKLGKMIELALELKDLVKVEKVLDIIKRYRRAGLDKHGEFGPENLAFKALRKQGIIQDLFDLRKELHGSKLSIEEVLDKESAAKVYWSQDNYMSGGKVNQMYTLYTAAAQDKNKNILKYNFYNFPKHDLTAVEFSRAVGPWGDGFGIDNAGDQYTVFATLIQTLKEYLSKHKTKFIMFGAKEPGRAKLYQTFVNRFANKFGYKQINPDSIPKPVSSMILNSGDTPFLLQKVGTVKEVLDPKSASELEWEDEGGGWAPYYVSTATAKDKNNNRLKYEFIYFSKFDLTNIEFGRAVGRRGSNYEINKAGDQYTVFATLIEAIKQYLSKNKPKFILFSAKEPSRVKLYKTFVNRFAGKFGYKQISPDNIPDSVRSRILSSSDTPFFLQKAGSETVDITEILNKASASRLKWDRDNKFCSTANTLYTLDSATAKDKNNNRLKYNFFNFPKYDLVVIEFARALGSQDTNYDIDNAGDQYTVFATLIEAIKQYLSENKPKFILFGAKEPNRAKLYQAFVNRFARQFGYKQVSNDNIPDRIRTMFLSLDDTPFLLQKVEPQTVHEVSGYIPSKKEKNDPRFKTALTVDVKPDSIKKNAKAFGFKVSRDGRPPLLRKQ